MCSLRVLLCALCALCALAAARASTGSGTVDRAMVLAALSNDSAVEQFVAERVASGDVAYATGNAVLDALVVKATLYVNAGWLDRALSAFTKVLDRDPQAVGALVGRGSAYAQLRRLVEAESDLRLAVRFSNSSDAATRYMQVLGAQGKSDAAAKFVLEYLPRAEPAPRPFLFLTEAAAALLRMKMLVEALPLVTELTVHYAGVSVSWDLHGATQLQLGRCRPAAESYLRAVTLAGDQATADMYTWLGQSYKECGNDKPAYKYLSRALQVDPSYERALFMRGLLLHETGQPRAALRDLLRCVELYPEQQQCRHTLANALHVVGLFEAADQQYGHVLALNERSLAFYHREYLRLHHETLLEPFHSVCPDLVTPTALKEAYIHSEPRSYLGPHFEPRPAPEGTVVHDDVTVEQAATLCELASGRDRTVTRYREAVAQRDSGSGYEHDGAGVAGGARAPPGTGDGRASQRLASLVRSLADEVGASAASWQGVAAAQGNESRAYSLIEAVWRASEATASQMRSSGGASGGSIEEVDAHLDALARAAAERTANTSSSVELLCGAVGAHRVRHAKQGVSVTATRFEEDVGAVRRLLAFARRVGRGLHLRFIGYLPNVRMQTALGMAAIEVAQRIHEELRIGKSLVDYGCVGRASGERYAHGWRDMYDVILRWREVAEPFTPIIWVDHLSAAGFDVGFGSHTHLQSGQFENMRYFPYVNRSLELVRELAPLELADQVDPAMLARIMSAQSMVELYNVTRRDVSVTIPCVSLIRRPGRGLLECARIMLERKSSGFDFFIQTRALRSRWALFEEEIVVAWQAYLDAARTQSPRSTELARRVLDLAFYWYNFLPLSRGTAASGYAGMLAMFLAVGVEIDAMPPADTTVDWEALLGMTPDYFSMKMNWMLEARVPSAVRVWELLPVRTLLPTRQARVDFLNMIEEPVLARRCTQR